MGAASNLRYCRRKAGLSQRALAAKAGVPQSTVARIENGDIVPRTDTLSKLLASCGYELELRRCADLDRSMIRALLAVSPGERLDTASAEARNLDRLLNR